MDEIERQHKENTRLFELSLDMLCVAGTDGYFRRVNRAFTKLGYTVEELLSKPFIEFVHPDDRKATLRELERLSEGVDTIDFENRYLCKNGDLVWLSWVCPGPIPGDDSLYAVAHDITERKRAEEELHRARDELELRVEERTIELRSANQQLQEEITERRRNQEALRSLTAQLSLAEDRERRRIAEGLHDDVGQSLALCAMKLGALAHSVPEDLRESFNDVRGILEQVIARTRSMTYELGSPVLYELGLEAALESITERLAKQEPLDIRFENDAEDKPLDEDVRVILYRATRELLMNVVKHAGATRIEVICRKVGGEIHIDVVDDGRGFDVAENTRATADGGFGLFTIRERLRQVGGHVSIRSSTEAGAHVCLVAPLRSA